MNIDKIFIDRMERAEKERDAALAKVEELEKMLTIKLSDGNT